MKIALITQNIKDPINFSSHFLNNLSLIIKEKFNIFLFTDTDKPLLTNYNTKQYNFISPRIKRSNHINLSVTDVNNIKKQINVYKKLGGKHNIWTLVTDYIDISEFYRKNFIEIRPDVLIVWNGITHSFQTAAVEVAKSFDIPVIFLERGLIPGSIFYDFQGVNAESEIGQNQQWQQQESLLTDKDIFNNIRKIIIETGGGLVAEKVTRSTLLKQNYIFFPLQRDTDSNMLFNSPYVKNMYSILNGLNNWCHKNNNIPKILVRPHPEDPNTHYTKHMNFENLTIQSDGALLETIQKANAIMTVNSTVGFTSLILDKVVIALGKSIYNNRELCIEPKNMNELYATLNCPNDWILNSYMREKRKDFVSKVIANSHISFQHNIFLDIQLLALKNKIYSKILL